MRAVASHPAGYSAGLSRPAAPQARPGSSSTGASSARTPRATPGRSAPGLSALGLSGPSGFPLGFIAQATATPNPTASASASGATNCWASRSTAAPGQASVTDLSRSRPAAVTPIQPISNPARAATPSPGQRRDGRARGQVAGQGNDRHDQPQRRPGPAVALRDRLRVPDASQHQQAAHAAERRVGPRGERGHPAGIGVHRVLQGGDQPGQAARDQGGERDGGTARTPGKQRDGHHDQAGDRHRRESADHGGHQRQAQSPGPAPRRLVRVQHGPQRPGQPGVAE